MIRFILADPLHETDPYPLFPETDPYRLFTETNLQHCYDHTDLPSDNSFLSSQLH